MAAKTPAKAKAAPMKAAKMALGKTPLAKSADGKTVLLSGGNPQIAKGYGDAPVQAYIAAVPGWQQALCAKLDALIVRAVPRVRKAVKWNTPLYGAGEDDGTWFMSFHVFAKYVKVGFFNGASLTPMPPGASKQKAVRYLDVREDDVLDEKQFVAWVKAAAKLPGEKM